MPICGECGQPIRTKHGPPQKLRAQGLDQKTRIWIVSRAAARDSEGRPAWSYPEISHMLQNSRRIVMSWQAIRRLVQTHAPEVFAWRHQARFGS